MKTIQHVSSRVGIAGELLSFFWTNKRWWMIPLITVLFVFGVFFFLAQSSAVAPFIYTFY